MYFLTKEQVEVVQGGDQQRISVLQPGSFFGELAILRDAPRAATIRALTDVEVYALRRDAVLQLARANADFNRYPQAAAYAACEPTPENGTRGFCDANPNQKPRSHDTSRIA